MFQKRNKHNLYKDFEEEMKPGEGGPPSDFNIQDFLVPVEKTEVPETLIFPKTASPALWQVEYMLKSRPLASEL